MKSAEDLCILGGLFAVFEYVITIFADLCRYLFEQTSWKLLDYTTICLENIESFAIIAFLILFFICFLGKKFAFLQKLTLNFPKISIYLFHLGLINYILFLIDSITMVTIKYAQFNEKTEEFLAYMLIIINILGILWAIITATQQILVSKAKQK